MWRRKPQQAPLIATIQLPEDLVASVQRALEHQLETLEAAKQETNRQRGGEQRRREVIQLATYVALVAIYSMIIAILNAPALVSSLLIPDNSLRNLRLVGDAFRQVVEVTPGPIIAFLIPLISSAALLGFSATSASVRINVGGSIFVGVIALALLGFSTAASTGGIGLLAALPGFVTAIVVLARFGDLIRGIVLAEKAGSSGIPDSDYSHTNEGPGGTWMALSPWQRRLTGAAHRVLGAFELQPSWAALLAPGSRLRLLVPFVGVPVVCAGLLGVLLHVGPRPPVGLITVAVLLGWVAWAFLATPGPLRIPLWSLVCWALAVLSVLALNEVTAVFAAATVVVLIINVVAATLRWPASREDGKV